MWGCVGTRTSCSTAITKHTICNKGLINIIFGQQLTLCYITMHIYAWVGLNKGTELEVREYNLYIYGFKTRHR